MRKRLSRPGAASSTRFALMLYLVTLASAAHADIRMWKSGAGQFNAVLHLQNTGNQAQQCAVSWANANGGFGDGRTVIVQPGKTEQIETRIVAMNESYRCWAYVDPFEARRAQEDEQRRRQQELQRQAQEEKRRSEERAKGMWDAMRDHERRQEQLGREAEQAERSRVNALKVEEMQQRQLEYEKQQRYQLEQQEALRRSREIERLKAQQRIQAQREKSLHDARLIFEQNQEVLNSTRSKADGYANENQQLERLIRAMENKR